MSPSSVSQTSDAPSASPLLALGLDACADVNRDYAVSLLYLGVKRITDLVVAVVALILLAPLMAVIAIAIKLDSPGPIIFRQRRPGYRGKPFYILKFRTMVSDAEERLPEVLHLNPEPGHRLIRIPNDPRVTRVGRILRCTSLDELPQLVNIIRGEMSLVGPRPISRPIDDPRGILRLAAVPGMTGLWQISGRKDTDCEFMLQKDMEYLRRRSLILDLAILLRTALRMAGRNGAK